MANIFKEGKMLSNVADSYLANAVADFDMPNGSLVVLGDLADDKTYAKDGLEYDTYKAAKVAAETDEVVIVDYAGISEGEIGGNNYKFGNKLYELVVPAGEITRVRRLALHDKFWVAKDNFNGAPVKGQYAIAEAEKLTLKPNAEKTANFCVKVLEERDLVAGMRNVDKMYLCEVVSL